MNPYTSMWTGVTPGDGPQAFHLVLLDNGRTAALADEVGRAALHCIRCSACLNVCPVYERTGGHAYGSVYPGPIGAVLSPQLTGVEDNAVAAVRVHRCAAPASTPARCASTSPRCWCTCARRHVEERPGGRARADGRGGRDGRGRLGDGRRRGGSRAAETGQPGGPAARPAPRPDPLAAAAAVGAGPPAATCPRRRRETFREWWAPRPAGGGADERAATRCWPGSAARNGRAPRPRRRRCRATTAAPARTRRVAPALVDLLADRLVDYKATVHRRRRRRRRRRRWPRRSPSTPAPVVVPPGPARRLVRRTGVPDDGRSHPPSWTASPPSSPPAPRRLRRDRHDRPRRLARPGPARHHAGARPARLRRARRAGRADRARAARPRSTRPARSP